MPDDLSDIVLRLPRLIARLATRVGLVYVGEGWARVLAMDPPGYPENAFARALAVFNGCIYVGTDRMEGLEIFRSKDGVKWERCVGRNGPVAPGFGDATNSSTGSMLVHGPHLYVGTSGGMWRTADGVKWDKVPGGPPAGIVGMAVFGGVLYAVSGWRDVWRWNEPGGWQPVVGAAPAPVKFGFGDPDITDIIRITEFGGCLYAGAGRDRPPTGISLWRSTNGTIWELFKSLPGSGGSLHVWALAPFKGRLYIGGYDMLHLYRTNGTLGDWEEVTDGVAVGTNKTGVWCLHEDGGKLYAGMKGADDFRILWSTSDGKMWTAVDTVALGERTDCDGVATFGGYVYVTTRDTSVWSDSSVAGMPRPTTEPRLEVWCYGALYDEAPWLKRAKKLIKRKPRVQPFGPRPPA